MHACPHCTYSCLELEQKQSELRQRAFQGHLQQTLSLEAQKSLEQCQAQAQAAAEAYANRLQTWEDELEQACGCTLGVLARSSRCYFPCVRGSLLACSRTTQHLLSSS